MMPENFTMNVNFYSTIFLLLVFHPLLSFALKPYITWKSNRLISESNTVEIQFPNTTTKTKTKTTTKTKIDLSFVIPAYNEQSRLPNMLQSTLAYTQSNPQLTYEFCVVSDGSTDDTEAVVTKFYKENNILNGRLIRLVKNRGKGAAIKTGMLQAKGANRLMVDADGATDISCLKNMFFAIETGKNDIAIGSRAHMAEESTAKRSPMRTLLMRGFHFFVNILRIRGGVNATIKDTQCGFKLFTASAATAIFSHLHLERWAFDLEVIAIANIKGLKMQEIQVVWEEIDGSKLDTGRFSLLINAVTMLRDMACLKICYVLHLWNCSDI